MQKDLATFVRERAGRRCEYCQFSEQDLPHPFQIDHIIAQQHDGPTDEKNLAWSCLWCNKRKGPNLTSIDPISKKVVALFHPRRHKWTRHFRWRGAILVGRTAIGRATVRLLEINHSMLVEIRQELQEAGLFLVSR